MSSVPRNIASSFTLTMTGLADGTMPSVTFREAMCVSSTAVSHVTLPIMHLHSQVSSIQPKQVQRGPLPPFFFFFSSADRRTLQTLDAGHRFISFFRLRFLCFVLMSSVSNCPMNKMFAAIVSVFKKFSDLLINKDTSSFC